MTRRVPAAIVVAVAISALGLSALAIAGSTPDPDIHDRVFGKTGGLRYARDTGQFDLGNNGYASLEAGCGSESRATFGGGFRMRGPGADGSEVSTSEPNDWYDTDEDPDDGWRAGAHGDSAGTLTAYSICSKDRPRYREVTVPDQASNVRLAKASCGGKAWHAISGGAIIASSNSRINSSYPYDGPDKDKRAEDGWAVRVFDAAGGGGGFQLGAVCVKGPVTYVSARSKAKGPGKQVTQRLDCAADEHAVAVGTKVSGNGAEAYLSNGYPFDDKDADIAFDDGFKAAAFNESGGKKTVRSTLICLG